MIELRTIEDNELYMIIPFISEDNLLLKTFGNGNNIKYRLLYSSYACYICLDGVDIGFINVVNKNDIFEIDMGIISPYRNKGYGTQALKLLKETVLFDNENIVIQTKKNNIAANKSVIDNEFKLIKIDKKYNYYVM